MAIGSVITRNYAVPTLPEKDRVKKSDSATDRDGQNQYFSGEEEEEKRELSDEELARALEYLRSLDSIKDSQLRVFHEEENGKVVVYVASGEGKIIRRIPARELLYLSKKAAGGSVEKQKGHLLNKRV